MATKKIINLTKNTRQIIEKILNIYRANADIFQLHRGEEKYTAKYRFEDGFAVTADVIVAPDCYRFHIMQEGYALMLQKPAFQPFDCGLSLHNNKVKFHQMPQQKEAREWLTSVEEKRVSVTRADALLIMATACEMIWSFLIPCMKVREYQNCIEYAPRDDFMTFVDEYAKNARKEYKEKHRLDGWDVVTLTDKQLTKLGATLEEHHIKHDFDNIAMHRFCLVLYHPSEKYTQYFFATHKGNTIHFEVEDDGSMQTAYCDILYKKTQNDQLELELSDNTNAMTWLTHTSDTEGMEDVTYWQWMVDMFFSVNSFMLHFGDVTMEVETKEATTRSEGRSGKKHDRKNTVRLFKSYKLIKNWKSQARKKAEITCPAWGVRGHFRHYRNGKVVFVEAYVKGKEKAKYKGKEYALLPYKEA